MKVILGTLLTLGAFAAAAVLVATVSSWFPSNARMMGPAAAGAQALSLVAGGALALQAGLAYLCFRSASKDYDE